MTDIDTIMGMLSCDREESVQEEGRKLAKNIESIGAFTQPRSIHFNENVWDNCALILSERTDQELIRYSEELLMWIQDLKWPGARCIFNRLKIFQGEEKDWLSGDIDTYLKYACCEENRSWKNNLQELRNCLNV
ncbi:MAG: DUF5071 domain-containing protein [Eubacteriales bacterium]|nr:DUF5071 domain-containing protein [Eubacteriales bacterium]